MDIVFYNGVIHTMAGRTVSALAVQNGRIALAGSDEAALALATRTRNGSTWGAAASCPGSPTATCTFCRPAWSATAWTCGA